MEIDIMGLISAIGSLIVGLGAGMLTKSGRIKAKADAFKAMADAYEVRITSLHTIIENCNKTEIEHSQRISELNHALNVKEDEVRDKTKQIRSINDKIYSSEQEVNRVQNLLNDAKDSIITLTEQRDEQRRLKEFYKGWRCEKSTCKDPEGRRPPNAKLANLKYKHPEKD